MFRFGSWSQFALRVLGFLYFFALEPTVMIFVPTSRNMLTKPSQPIQPSQARPSLLAGLLAGF
jgi:hypothetical protein